MKLLHTEENLFLLNNLKNIVENNAIETIIKNEYLAGVSGEVPSIESWPQLWVLDDNKFDEAMDLVRDNLAAGASGGKDWSCEGCGESNSPSFEICWQCQQVPKN